MRKQAFGLLAIIAIATLPPQRARASTNEDALLQIQCEEDREEGKIAVLEKDDLDDEDEDNQDRTNAELSTRAPASDDSEDEEDNDGAPKESAITRAGKSFMKSMQKKPKPAEPAEQTSPRF